MGPDRPSVWLVSPAWRRFDVTRLALAQRAHLAVELAARGIDAHCVIVADDDNLDIARSHGFATVEMDNDHGLGRRFNAGYTYAAAQGADYLVHIGSDDWIHPDAFTPLLAPQARPSILAGRRIAFVDLIGARLRCAVLDGPTGVIPWIIPRRYMERCGHEPIRPDSRKGMDGYLVRGIRRTGSAPRFTFHDPHALARVDFKSQTNINSYATVARLLGRDTQTDPWVALAEHYPPHLVALARQTHLDLQEAPVPKMTSPDGRVVSVSRAGVDALLARGYTTVGGEKPAPPKAAVTTDAVTVPAKSATKADWIAYAESQGVTDAESLTKGELVERFGD